MYVSCVTFVQPEVNEIEGWEIKNWSPYVLSHTQTQGNSFCGVIKCLYLLIGRFIRTLNHTTKKIIQCKVENFKKSKKFWQGPPSPAKG